MGTTFRAVRQYMLRHLWLLLAGGVLIVIANLIALVPAAILNQAIGVLQNHEGAGALARDALLLVGVAVLAGVFSFFARYAINGVSRHIEYEMRSDLFKHFQVLDLEYFQQRKLGDLVARATNDLSAVRQMLGPGISNLTNAVVAVTVTAIVMWHIDRQLTLYTLTVMPLITVLFIVVGGGIRRRYRKVQDQFGEVSARAQENFSGIRVVKAYAQERHELEAFNRINAQYVAYSISYARLNSLLWPSMYFVSGLAVAILLWRGGVDVLSGRIQLGQLVQFNAYLAALSWPMIALGWTVNLFQQGSASLSRIEEVRGTAPAIADGALTDPEAVPTRGVVELRDVSLRYGEGEGEHEHEALHGINLRVPAGTSLGIVGPTGAGKSSLVNLLARVYDVSGGAVLIDGRDVREIPLAALRRTIGYVPQETFLFSVAVRENVGFGVEHTLSDEKLERALQVSQLGKDLADFPHGADTMVGERGVTLSGGQKQRAGIARAVAKDPLILVLDDALSSVDTNTEATILRELRAFMRGRTSILIAHRISTVKDLDQIVVLDEGRIVERGAHAELLALGGLYAAMYRRQLLGEELEGGDDESLDLGDDTSGLDGAGTGDGRRDGPLGSVGGNGNGADVGMSDSREPRDERDQARVGRDRDRDGDRGAKREG
ncbi:MAG TPA: ABC transporter ATP-binding protein [Ktedonobacterales bacterium]